MTIQAVTAIIVNYKTESLVRGAIESLLGFYPELRMIVIDNGSHDGSTEYLRAIYTPSLRTIVNDKNIGHGPAMHQGLLAAMTRYAFLMDTDCIVRMGGFLEIMYSWFLTNPQLYAVGWKRCVDKYSGVPTSDDNCGKEGFCWYIHPHAAMIDVEKYFTLEPFDNDGAPCIKNMRSARVAGYLLEAFPIEDYVTHLVAGTRRMWSGAWDVGNSQPTQEWRENEHYPI